MSIFLYDLFHETLTILKIFLCSSVFWYFIMTLFFVGPKNSTPAQNLYHNKPTFLAVQSVIETLPFHEFVESSSKFICSPVIHGYHAVKQNGTIQRVAEKRTGLQTILNLDAGSS